MPAEFGWHFMRNCEIIREHVLPGGELNQPKWVGPARGGWEQLSLLV